MTKLIKAFLGLLLSVILLTGCSGSNDDTKDAGKDNNASVTNTVTQGGEKTGDITPQIGKDVDISNLDDATLKIYPEEKKYSMYFYNAKEISDDVFYKEPEEDISGDLHPALQDDACTNLVHQRLVLSCFLSQSSLEHRLMRQHTGITLVPHLYRNVRYCFLQLPHECFHSRKIVTIASVGLLWQSHHKAFHLFLRHIALEKLHQLMRLHGG